jgi:dTDP-4-amino-4,6-dideoxygalactose transaminase
MFPASQRAYEASVSLPIYPAMSDADVQRVIDAVRRVLAGPSVPQGARLE